MARTSDTAVKAVLAAGGDYDTAAAPSLDPYIETASAIVDDIDACDNDRDNVLDSTRLELIERWLAAHLYAVSDQTYQSKSTSAGGSSASATFQGKTGMYYESTRYGQTAVRLDKSGCLSTEASGERKMASLTWLGKAENDQIEWTERN